MCSSHERSQPRPVQCTANTTHFRILMIQKSCSISMKYQFYQISNIIFTEPGHWLVAIVRGVFADMPLRIPAWQLCCKLPTNFKGCVFISRTYRLIDSRTAMEERKIWKGPQERQQLCDLANVDTSIPLWHHTRLIQHRACFVFCFFFLLERH